MVGPSQPNIAAPSHRPFTGSFQQGGIGTCLVTILSTLYGIYVSRSGSPSSVSLPARDGSSPPRSACRMGSNGVHSRSSSPSTGAVLASSQALTNWLWVAPPQFTIWVGVTSRPHLLWHHVQGSVLLARGPSLWQRSPNASAWRDWVHPQMVPVWHGVNWGNCW